MSTRSTLPARARRFTAVACAVASLGVGLVGLSGAAAVPAAPVGAEVPEAESAAHPVRPLGGMRSRLDLGTPALGFEAAPGVAADLLFHSQGSLSDGYGDFVGTRATIFDTAGRPVWVGPEAADSLAGVRPVTVAGQPGIAYVADQDRAWVLLDSSYREIRRIPLPTPSREFSPLIVTNPAGTRALITGARTDTADLTALGGLPSDRIGVPLVHEIDLATGDTVFSWDALTPGPGHIPPTESLLVGAQLHWRSYANVTGIAYDEDGDILIASEATGAVYKLDRATGAIAWALGGKRNSFAFADGTEPPRGPRALHLTPDGTLAILDPNPADPRELTLVSYRIDETARTAAAAPGPRPTIPETNWDLPRALTVQTLSNGNLALSGSGAGAFEYDATGTKILQTHAADTTASPVTRAPWHATPRTAPDAGLELSGPKWLAVYASWNGATEVATWRISVGPNADRLRPMGTAAWAGIETKIGGELADNDTVVRVEALGADGAVLATAMDLAITPLDRAHAAAGAQASALGRPTSLTEPWLGGLRRHFENGDIYWRADTGALVVGRDMAEFLDAGGSDADFPRTGTTPTPNRRGTYLLLKDGGLYQADGGEVVAVRGDFWDKYAAMGWENGPLGFPRPTPRRSPDGTTRLTFDGGTLFRIPEGRVTETHGAIGAYMSGRDGYPLTDEGTTPDGVGRYNHFRSDYGDFSVYWTAGTGPVPIGAAFRTKWAATGWERGPLGYPAAESTVGAPGANYQPSQRGTMYQTASGAFYAKGAIFAEWGRTGWERGPLGLPRTDELATPDGVGRYNHFDRGSLYWSPASGAHFVLDRIAEAWGSAGWERGGLGYPVTSEAGTPDGRGSYAHFQGGSVYDSAWGAHRVSGEFRAAWASLGWERGRLGFPKTSEYSSGGIVYQDFEGGGMSWDPRTRKTAVRYF